ncbi:ATP-dependent DNA helicase DinG [Sessilibacter corallicola]|uniref:ATP-dependent DNA helicase DinG n=1 Tax=Sessilibacter corallicola TaxID=2904075 RepID=UPI001E5BBE8A|nr:ATP-dependent DNA helicase DinG [Sessilibacter corallicola]MCE2028758.1 ATP-dependent DNA helicase DinG [Sessilibacter corallicola]
MLSDEIKQTIQGAYSQFLTSQGLKARYGQKLMIAEIARTLAGIKTDENHRRVSDGQVCVVEAGTGTGKTVAYLLAAIPVAQLLNKKLVVSTATVALQEQIVYKDLPELKQHSGLEFSYSLAKGRRRYLCLNQLDRVLHEQQSASDPTRALYEDEMPDVSEEDIVLYRSMMDALASGDWDGDKDDWKDELENKVWFRVTTDHRQCTGRKCSNVSQCSFFKARDDQSNVDIIVTNHDMVLSDLALGGGAILPAPEDSIYVFDEGHHLPDKALNHFSSHVRVISTTRWLDQCIKSVGPLLSDLGESMQVSRLVESLPNDLTATKSNMELLWPQLQALAGDLADSQEKSPKYRFPGGEVPERLRELALNLHQDFVRLHGKFEKLCQEVEDLLEDKYGPIPKVDLENWFPVLGLWSGRAEASIQLWSSYAHKDAASLMPKARWLTLFDTGAYVDIEICSSPILAANNLTTNLWNQCCAAVVTSATLAALGHFERYRMRSGTPEDSVYQIVPSPFNFANARFQVPATAFDASKAEQHTQSVIEQLPELINVDEGSLVLFSSRRQMQDVFEGLPSRMQRIILLQGERSKQETIRTHKLRIDDDEGSILFGLASFAEGLDLPGNYCKHVIIAKIPFSVPDDPVEASLAEWIDAKGGNAFMEMSVPDAAIKLVQACGRLLRKESDEGTITVLDNRLLTRRYGKTLIESLPPYNLYLNK